LAVKYKNWTRVAMFMEP